MDLVKNRMQVSGEGGQARLYTSSIHCAKTIFKTEGILGFYNGLSASFARQLSYTTVRLGVYNVLLDRYSVNGRLINDLRWLSILLSFFGTQILLSA